MFSGAAKRGKIRPSKSEDEKENGSLASGLQGSRLLPSSSSPSPPPAIPPSRTLPLSDVEDYASNHHLNSRRHLRQHHHQQSFLPDISSNAKYGVTSKVQVGGPHQLTQFWTYSPGLGGSVDHWKKLARKAELEMHLEQEQHKSDREKDLDSIHRLRCRQNISIGSCGSRQGCNAGKTKEEDKLLEIPIRRCKQEIRKGVKAPESIHQGTAVKGSKKVWKKPGESNDESIHGFDDFTMPKGDLHGTKDVSVMSVMKRRQAKTTMAGKILQLRSDNSLLVSM